MGKKSKKMLHVPAYTLAFETRQTSNLPGSRYWHILFIASYPRQNAREDEKLSRMHCRYCRYLFDDGPEDASVAFVVDAVREREVNGVVLALRHA